MKFKEKKRKGCIGIGIRRSTNQLIISFKVPKRFSRNKYIVHKFYFGPEKAYNILESMKKLVGEVVDNEIMES